MQHNKPLNMLHFIISVAARVLDKTSITLKDCVLNVRRPEPEMPKKPKRKTTKTNRIQEGRGIDSSQFYAVMVKGQFKSIKEKELRKLLDNTRGTSGSAIQELDMHPQQNLAVVRYKSSQGMNPCLRCGRVCMYHVYS